MGPSVPAKPVTMQAEVALAFRDGSPAATLTISDAQDVVGFSADISLATTSELPAGAIVRGEFLERSGRRLMLMVRELPGREKTTVRLAGVLSGGGTGVSGSGDLVHLTLSDSDAWHDGRLEAAQILDASGVIAWAAGPPTVRPEQLVLVPAQNALYQNLPNPFNPATVIPFAVAHASRVRLTVYSALGQQIATLVAGRLEPGYHKVAWDGRDDGGRRAASGVYIYRIEIGDFADVKKLLLLR
jgi:hypothetical protein